MGFPRTPFTRKGYAASVERHSRKRLPYLTVAENLPLYRQSHPVSRIVYFQQGLLNSSRQCSASSAAVRSIPNRALLMQMS